LTATRRLRELGGADVATVGPKAARLGELIRRGHRVPDGFVITTDVYAAHLETPREQRHRSEIVEAYLRLASASVAVRSSATAEDMPAASFAGQQATFLNVRGVDDLFAAVEACWRSIFSERAIHYRRSRGLDRLGVRMAVVVQQMVPARAAGVAFSIDPTTGGLEDVLVEAGFGLGEAVVGGEVTPDLYLLDKATMAIRRKGVNQQTWGYYCDSIHSGTVRRPIAAPGAPVLTDRELRELAAVVRDVEAHFGCPQDVEWAVDETGRLFVLQARPVTGVAAQPRSLDAPARSARTQA
jgi:pyruvate,water dikinase